MAELIRRHRIDAWAVFWSGPVAWFLQQLILYQLTLPSCHGRPWLAPLVGAAFLLLPAAGIVWSYRALQQARVIEVPRPFILLVGGVAAAFFLVAMIWQEVGTLAYSGCER
jgi:hypothetical protein